VSDDYRLLCQQKKSKINCEGKWEEKKQKSRPKNTCNSVLHYYCWCGKTNAFQKLSVKSRPASSHQFPCVMMVVIHVAHNIIYYVHHCTYIYVRICFKLV
jgi:hypothetical protein